MQKTHATLDAQVREAGEIILENIPPIWTTRARLHDIINLHISPQVLWENPFLSSLSPELLHSLIVHSHDIETILSEDVREEDFSPSLLLDLQKVEDDSFLEKEFFLESERKNNHVPPPHPFWHIAFLEMMELGDSIDSRVSLLYKTRVLYRKKK